MYKVLLFYKFVDIKYPEREQKAQIRLCQSLNLKGRTIIAKEGINSTVAGRTEDVERYKKAIWDNPIFSDIEFKENTSENLPFKKLSVKVRDEIITLKYKKMELSKKAKYIEPEELHEIIDKSGKDYYIIDMRNNYETDLGKFKASIPINTDNFKDLPKKIKNIKNLKNKKIITVCTGGIRCEKASALLIQNGFKNVYQLHGGIIKYGQKYPDEGFEGKCYVFDERVSIEINSKDRKKIISKCHYCGNLEDTYINCANVECNKQFICCSKCNEVHKHCCSDECVRIKIKG
jgi:UPF0176 protein